MGNADQKVIAGEGLHRLIPQRPPMVLIDALIKAENKEAETRFEIKEDNIFVENRTFTEFGVIENIAQTAAAGIGKLLVDPHEPAPIGFIGAVQNLEINRLPKVGDHLKTVITVTHQVMNITVVHGIVYLLDESIACCDMKLFLQD